MHEIQFSFLSLFLTSLFIECFTNYMYCMGGKTRWRRVFDKFLGLGIHAACAFHIISAVDDACSVGGREATDRLIPVDPGMQPSGAFTIQSDIRHSSISESPWGLVSILLCLMTILECIQALGKVMNIHHFGMLQWDLIRDLGLQKRDYDEVLS